MPLDQYNHKCCQLLGHLDIYMRQNFNIKKSTDEIYDEEEDSQVRTLYQTKKQILELEKKKYEEELNVAGINYIVNNIDEYRRKINTDFQDMRSLIDSIEMENENLDAHFSVLQEEAQMLVEQDVERKIINVFNDFYKGKSKRAT